LPRAKPEAGSTRKAWHEQITIEKEARVTQNLARPGVACFQLQLTQGGEAAEPLR